MSVNHNDIQKLFELAANGDSRAKNSLGAMFAMDGGDENERAALYWYLEAVDDGYVDSIWNAASMLINGEGGVDNIEFGRYLAEIAANNGSDSACLFLAASYEAGQFGYKKNPDLARKWLSAAWNFEDEHDFVEPIQVDDFLAIRPNRPGSL